MYGGKAAFGGYRTVEEVEEWKKKDPIALMERELKKIGLLTDDDVKSIKADAIAEMDEADDFAVKFAVSKP